MGFNLKRMFEDLEALLNSERPNKVKLKLLQRQLAEHKKYADQCGQLD